MENQNFSNSPTIIENAYSRDVDLILKSIADKKSIKDFLLDDSEMRKLYHLLNLG